jgi:hypothetical protein
MKSPSTWERTTAAERRLSVVEVTPQNARLVPELLARVDASFADPALHDAEQVAALVRQGEQSLFVGVDVAGRPRGLIALAFSLPTRAIAEVGLVVTDPALELAARGRVMQRLMSALMSHLRPLVERAGLRALVSSEVASDDLSRKLVQRLAFVPTGVVLPPRGGDRLAVATSGTISVRCVVRRIAPYSVSLPSRFAELLSAIYGALRMPVAFRPGAPASGPTIVSERERRGFTVLDVAAVGSDAAAVLHERLAIARPRGSGLLVILPLAQVELRDAVDALCSAGLRYAALVPFWGRSDALILQSVGPERTDFVPRGFNGGLASRILAEVAG